MSMITYKNVPGYVNAKPNLPGVIILPEFWGLNDQIKGLSDKFASAGFSVVAPDLYHGKVAKDASEARHLMSDLNFHAAVIEMEIWVEYLKTEFKAKKVGVAGFCMGGALSVACASKLKIDAAVPFYGIADLTQFPVSTISCPLLLQFGLKDHGKGFSDPETVKKFCSALDEAGKTYRLESYPEADHGFMNECRPDVYREDDAKKAFQNTIEFLHKSLK